MLSLKQIEIEVMEDLEDRHIVDIRRSYREKDEMYKVLIVMKCLKIANFTKLFDYLISKKFEELIIEGGYEKCLSTKT